MSDDVTTSEAARVLGEHSHYAPDASERGDLAGANWECADCAHALGVSFDDDPTSAMAAHQAAMLAEAGLLRDKKAIADLGQSIIALLDQVGQQQAQIATQEPAGEPGAGSAGRGASGGLGERLRAMADEADRLEEALRSTTHQLELEQDDVCIAHGTVRPCRHCAYAASASEGTW